MKIYSWNVNGLRVIEKKIFWMGYRGETRYIWWSFIYCFINVFKRYDNIYRI